jgi:hypothetical protein
MKGRWIEYSEAELIFIESNCKLTRADLTAQFNESFGRDLSVANIASLCKRNGWLTGRDGQYKKGNVPHPNSGLKGPNSTSFKKGSVPANTRPMFSERITKDGYIEMKVPERNPHTGAETRFRLKHLWLWEQANGPLPESHAVVFKDGDRQNCDLSNLECVHRRVLQAMNKSFKPSEYPKEVRPSLLAVSQLSVSARQRAKGENQPRGENPCSN